MTPADDSKTQYADRLASVAIVVTPYLREFHVDLINRLKADFNSKIVILYHTKQERAFFEENVGSVVDEFVLVDHLLRLPNGKPLPDAPAVLERGRRLEERIGATINRMTMTHRHYGRGFALAGFHHPRSQITLRATYPEIVRNHLEYFEVLEGAIERHGITLLLGGGLPAVFAMRHHGIPFRTFVEARYKDHYKWVHDEYFIDPNLQIAFDAMTDEEVGAVEEHVEEPAVTKQFMGRVRKTNTFLQLTKKIAFITARQTYWKIRGMEKAKIGYFLWDRVRFAWRRWRDSRRLTSASMPKQKDLEGKRYVFFPLHTEPERSLQLLSPENFFQLSTIASVARDLPADVFLVVKEHLFAVGRRPQDFYDQIRSFKNVIFLDASERGIDIVRNSAAVVTITSTVGLEAGLMGKQVICFGQHNFFNILPHVHVVETAQEVRSALHDALKQSPDATEDARMAGRRLQLAIAKTSTPMGRLSQWNTRGFSDDQFENAYAMFLESFAGEALSEAPAKSAGNAR